ncbi:hypothetical protein GCM10011494_21360 [Novosphingobium endophyticum]|uniref:Uncharacterized protein n=1 Tax=Novosphingobium endophyticum TaxID=1955250 RepID=A0A916TSY6_9SPHN|nr:hypothetical protein GCM10011494_21360 [Novosphingobium endophyticum]
MLQDHSSGIGDSTDDFRAASLDAAKKLTVHIVNPKGAWHSLLLAWIRAS